MIFLTTCVVMAAGLAKAVADHLAHKNDDLSAFSGKWWGDSSWEVKYASPRHKAPMPWYYFGLYLPDFKERFPFSTTLLKPFTEAWGFFDSLRTFVLLTIVVIAISDSWMDGLFNFLLLKTAHSTIFQTGYSALNRIGEAKFNNKRR